MEAQEGSKTACSGKETEGNVKKKWIGRGGHLSNFILEMGILLSLPELVAWKVLLFQRRV